jgi:hypothetical protein
MATDYTLPKYAGCTTYDEVNAKDANYLTTDIVDGVWAEHLPDLEQSWGSENTFMFRDCTNLTTFNGDLSSLSHGARMFF